MNGCLAALIVGLVIALLAFLARVGIALLAIAVWNWTTYRGRDLPTKVLAEEAYVPRDVLSGERQLPSLALSLIVVGAVLGVTGAAAEIAALAWIGGVMAFVPIALMALSTFGYSGHERAGSEKQLREDASRRGKMLALLQDRMAGNEEATETVRLFRHYWRALLQIEELQDCARTKNAPDPAMVEQIELDLATVQSRAEGDAVLEKRWSCERARLDTLKRILSGDRKAHPKTCPRCKGSNVKGKHGAWMYFLFLLAIMVVLGIVVDHDDVVGPVFRVISGACLLATSVAFAFAVAKSVGGRRKCLTCGYRWK